MEQWVPCPTGRAPLSSRLDIYPLWKFLSLLITIPRIPTYETDIGEQTNPEHDESLFCSVKRPQLPPGDSESSAVVFIGKLTEGTTPWEPRNQILTREELYLLNL